MKDFFYNKKIAAIAFIGMVLFAVFVIGGRDLKKEANVALDVFYGKIEYGKNDYGIDVSLECDNIIGNGKNLLIIASKYLDDNEASVVVLREYTQEAPSKDRAARARELTAGAALVRAASHEVMVKLFTMDIADKDREYLIKIEADIEAAIRKSGLSGYGEFADEFNELITNPYTGFIAKVNRIKELPIIFFR